jgi:hypothetical protein
MTLMPYRPADTVRSLSCIESEISMQKFTIAFFAAALVTATAFSVSAQTLSPGSASIHAQIKNATPIIERAACTGRTGSHGCGAGFVWNGRRCVPC